MRVIWIMLGAFISIDFAAAQTVMERSCTNARLMVDSRLNSSMSENRATGYCSFHAGVPPGLLQAPETGDEKAQLLFDAGQALITAASEEIGTEPRLAALSMAARPMTDTLLADLDAAEFADAESSLSLVDPELVYEGVSACLSWLLLSAELPDFEIQIDNAVGMECQYDAEAQTFDINLAADDAQSSVFFNLTAMQSR